MNKEQKEAVEYTDGPLLVIAGAGTGKTYTINEKVKYLISHGYDPKKILLLTFTRDAANEMKERIGNDDVWAGTFHSFCVRLLRKYCGELKMKRNFTIISGDDVEQAIKVVMNGQKIEGMDEKKIALAISTSVNKSMDFTDMFDDIGKAETLKKVADEYKRFKIMHNMMDFDDLLVYTLSLLQIPAVRKAVEDSYEYICVDEYQDTNSLQERIVLAIRQKNKKLMVVGDDAQSIYAFRGAEVENILTFADRIGAKVVKLTKNYRSTQPILSFSNAVMRACYEGIKKDLISDAEGKAPIVRSVGNTKSEANYISKIIKVLHEHNQYSIAVLARTGAEMADVEAKFISEGIPYVKKGGTSLAEQNFVKDFQTFFRLALNEDDEMAKIRLFSMIPGVGPKSALNIAEGRKENMTAEEMLAAVKEIRAYPKDGDKKVLEYYRKFAKLNVDSKARKKGKEPNYTNLNNQIEILKNIVSSYNGNIEDFLDTNIESESDEEKEHNKVVLSTIHSAKGLEYDTVFILNCVEGTFPFTNDVQESLRCFYVGITRARKNLILLCPRTVYNSKFHRVMKKEDSRFINSALKEVRCFQ